VLNLPSHSLNDNNRTIRSNSTVRFSSESRLQQACALDQPNASDLGCKGEAWPYRAEVLILGVACGDRRQRLSRR
jgi:hypothetical protein